MPVHRLRNRISRPIFLVGAERSGTTLLRLMLDHHPQISFFSEFECSVDRVADDGSWPSLTDFYDFLSTNRPFLTSGFTIDHTLDYPSQVDDFLRQKLARDGKTLVGATVHRHFNRLLFIWPDARFIHLVRDPRDVARSNIAIGWAGNTWTGADRWLDAERLWDSLVGRLPAGDWIDIRYECLVENPVQVLENICGFAGIPFHDNMLGYHMHSTYSPPDTRNIERWRKDATDLDVQLVEAKAGDLLQCRGYALSGLDPVHIKPRQEAKLRRQCRWARRRFAIRQFGPMLVAASFLSRRLPFKNWRKQIQLRMNDVVNAHVK